MARSKGEPKVQISVGVKRPLRKQLEAAAKQSFRSLSAEIEFRLRSSFSHKSDAPERLAPQP